MWFVACRRQQLVFPRARERERERDGERERERERKKERKNEMEVSLHGKEPLFGAALISLVFLVWFLIQGNLPPLISSHQVLPVYFLASGFHM